MKRDYYYLWTKDLARDFLLKIDSELQWLQLGVAKSKPFEFIVVLDNQERANLLRHEIEERGGYINKWNHGQKTSWIYFMIPAQARAWKMPVYKYHEDRGQ